MKSLFKRFRKSEDGAALIEYALLCALVALAAVAGMQLLGGGINTAFSNVNSQLTSALPSK